jgi:predicted dehydrogenase
VKETNVAQNLVRWGILSTAGINKALIPAIRNAERSELAAVASRDQARAEDYAQENGIARAFGSYEAMLADPDIDAVYISLPNGFHEEWSIKCADAGKHVLCEKPLALTLAEVDNIQAAAQRNGVVIQEAQMYRFHPQTHKLIELIQGGAIGDVLYFRGTFSFTLRDLNDVRLDPAIGGGSLWDVGSYPVSYARIIMGGEPTRVFAWQKASDRGVDLDLTGQMWFDGQRTAQIWCSFSGVAHWGIEVIGTEGHVYLDQPWKHKAAEHMRGYIHLTRGSTASGSGETEMLEFPGDAYQYQVESMAASILDGAPVGLPLESSRGNIATMLALYESARSGQVVEL